MRGFFDPIDGSAKVELEISGSIPNSQRTITALFDTGHNGSLSLPIINLIEIGATLRGYGEVRYASGHTGVVYYFSVNVTIDGQTREVQAGMIENPVAMEAIAGLELFAEYISLIDFKNKTIGFLPEADFQKMMAQVPGTTSPSRPPPTASKG